MKSRNRNKKQQKLGSNKHNAKLSGSDLFNKNEAYKSKYIEFEALELAELKALEGTQGGVYERALESVIKEKELNH